MALDTTSLAALLEALRTWLVDNPNGDIQDFADEHGVEVADLADAWNAYHTQADFSRNYDLDTDTTQTGSPSAVQTAPIYTPSEPPPYGSSPEVYQEYLTKEVNNYQEFTTVNNITNNIEDNSFNQQIIDSEVQQDIDIDNSDVTQGDGSVNIDDSDLTDSPINTGDLDDGSVLNQGDDNVTNTGDLDDGSVLQVGDDNVANTGDVTATDGGSASVGGDATSIGSGNDNFGEGQQAVNVAVGDGNEQAAVNQDNDTDIDQDATSGDTGDATGGAGGRGGSGGDGGDGGDSPDFFGGDGDGGDGGAGGTGGAGGDATSGDSGSANNDADVDNSVDIDFS